MARSRSTAQIASNPQKQEMSMSLNCVTEAAKEVRKILKANFSDTKFCVKSKRINGYPLIHISYTDERIVETKVEELVAHIKQDIRKHDCYHLHIHAERHYSIETLTEVINSCRQKYAECKDATLEKWLNGDFKPRCEVDAKCFGFIGKELRQLGSMPNR